MKMQKKRIVQCGLSLICAFGIALSGMSVHAEEVDSLEDKTSNLQSQLEGINQDLAGSAVFLVEGLQLIIAVLLMALGLVIVINSLKAYFGAKKESEA